jgi:type VI secretion system protein ImpF
MKAKKGQLLRASILDRLIDERPDLRTETEKQRYQLVDEIKEGVKRDLEQLLNTRFRAVSAPSYCLELEKSLINYGLPDLNTFNFISGSSREQFCRIVEEHIRNFEPRFKSVKVTIPDDISLMGDSLNFRIEAIMYADPAPEEIVFNSSLEPITNVVHIDEVH